MNNAQLARQFAVEAHGEQRYGRAPYVAHLDEVAGVLSRFGHAEDEVSVAAAFLHDVLEDTDTTEAGLRVHFGDDIADVVLALTDPRCGSRSEKKNRSLPRIRKLPRAVLVKLADRIANVEASLSLPHFYEKYRREQKKFEKVLRVEGEFDEMWDYLSGLFAGTTPHAIANDASATPKRVELRY
jgi:guanosine-3',5'-bis(diphosphate) 3'-pyrophosphohydrolase